MLSIGQDSPVEVVSCEFYLWLEGRDHFCVFADAHDDLDGAAVTESEKLLESDGMDVLRLVEGDEEEEGKFGEWFWLEDGIFFEDLMGELVSVLQHFCFEEEVDEVAEGE